MSLEAKMPIYKNIDTKELLGEVRPNIRIDGAYPYAMLVLGLKGGIDFGLVRIEQEDTLLHIYIYADPSEEDYTSCITIDLAKFQEAL